MTTDRKREDLLEEARKAGFEYMEKAFEPLPSTQDILAVLDERLERMEERIILLQKSTRGESRLWAILAGVLILLFK